MKVVGWDLGPIRFFTGGICFREFKATGLAALSSFADEMESWYQFLHESPS